MDREIVVEELKVTKNRTRNIYMRRSRAQINKALTPAMLDAQREIELAYRCAAGHMGYVLSRFEDTPRGSMARETRESWIQMQVKNLREWEKGCKYSDIVLDIDVFAKQLQDMVAERGVTLPTITRWYRLGLNDYCILQGWGDQINPKTVRDD